MAVPTLAEALEREHRDIDSGIEVVIEGLKDEELRLDPLHRAMTALRRHIYLEEEFLFPPLRETGLIAPVFVMVREHGQMWRTLDALAEELRSHQDIATITNLCRTLGELESSHNPKEEQILYSQVDHVLSNSANTDLRTFLDFGQMPAGWVCEAARS